MFSIKFIFKNNLIYIIYKFYFVLLKIFFINFVILKKNKISSSFYFLFYSQFVSTHHEHLSAPH